MKISVGFDGWLLLLGIIFSKNSGAGAICLLCAAVHELGHLCAARVMGIKIRELKLGFAGAKIYPENGILPYKKEFFLCIWGPIFNIILAFISLIILIFLYSNSPPASDDVAVQIFELLSGADWELLPVLLLIVVVSLMQAAVNLLPIESLDGGRMMVCLLSVLGSASLAYRAEKCTTFFSAGALWLLSTYLLLRYGAGIGIFVFAGCIFAKLVAKEGR